LVQSATLRAPAPAQPAQLLAMDCGCFAGLIASKRKEGKVKLGYWAIRGLGAPMRMLLQYAGADFEDKRYADPKEWFGKDKPELQKKNPLANLPYLVDGDVVVCQTNAIFDYLGDRYGLSGETMEQRRACRQLLAEVYDLRNAIIELVYPFKEKCRTDEEFKMNMTKHLQLGCKAFYTKLESVYAMTSGRGPYALGQKICTADFHVWEMLDQHEVYASKLELPSPLAGGEFPSLAKLHTTVKELPVLSPYFESEAASLPCNAAGMSYTSKLLGC